MRILKKLFKFEGRYGKLVGLLMSNVRKTKILCSKRKDIEEE